MRKFHLKALILLASAAWSGMAAAVGFGGINVTSSLGRPLSAEIELVSVSQADKASLAAKLASPDAFKGAGIDYPATLPKLKFSIETRSNGEPYIKLISTQPVNEPFVSLLIELSWSSGRLLREYTFLLDPPGFVAEQPAEVAVKPIEPVVVAPAVVASAPVATPEPEPVQAVTPVAEAAVAAASAPAEAAAVVAASQPVEAAEVAAASAPVAEEAKPAEAVVAAPAAETIKTETPAKAEEKKAGPESVTVKRGDTLSKIALETKATDVSLERMLVALYRTNNDAFAGKNMNRLRTGKILHMPQEESLDKLSQTEAVKEVRAQVADWNAYRQKLAGAMAASGEQHATQEASGKISTAVVDKAPATKAPAAEVLKLSKGEAPGDQTTAGGKAGSAKEKAKEKANARDEEAVAKNKALKESEQRTAMLEQNIKEMQRLVELKNQAAAQAASAATAAPVAKPKPVAPKVVAPPPSLLDDIMGNPVYLGAGAAVVLGLGGLLLMRVRQGKSKDKKFTGEETGSSTGRIVAPVEPSPDTGDFTSHFTPVAETAGEELDPIGEADMFLNFGRDVQAEEVLKDALLRDPANNKIKLKLLSIYSSRKDTKSFYVYAMEIKESGDEAAWAQAAAMGLALEPANPVYGGAEAAAAPAQEAAVPAVDFDLGSVEENAGQAMINLEDGLNKPAVGEQTSIMSAAELQSLQEAPMDFDVTTTRPGINAVSAEEPKLDVTSMDFDVTGTHPGLTAPTEEAQQLDVAAMDFDITSAHLGTKAPAEPAQAQAAEMSGIDFDVTGVQGKAAEPAKSAETEPLPSLNLDDLVFEAPAQSKVEPEQRVEPAPAQSAAAEADKGLEFSIDIPDIKAEPAAPAAPALGLGEISLSLDDVAQPASAPAQEVKDERWQEVATKLDLAKAYQEMGDQAGAREILEEVVRDGDEQQRATAQELLQQLG